jgi:hypothetical protein
MNKLALSIFWILIVVAVVIFLNGKINIPFVASIYDEVNKALVDTVNRPFSVLNQGINNQSPPIDKTKEIDLEQVNNLGYTFYLGQIDNPGTAPISDATKNNITRVIYNSKFPKSILEKIPIVFVNNLALKPGQYIAAPGGNMKVIDFGAGFLYEGGIYATYTSGNSIIYVNNDVLARDSLVNILTHELGHAIGSTLTDADWRTYFGLRNIPPGTSMEGGLWNLSPAEDFAEVYKNTFTGLEVRTYYGLLIPVTGLGFGDLTMEHTCGSIYRQIYENYIAIYEKTNPTSTCSPTSFILGNCSTDMATLNEEQKKAADATNADPQVQECRRKVMASPNQYPDDYVYGTPYKSTVGPQTKEFINTIMSRFN